MPASLACSEDGPRTRPMDCPDCYRKQRRVVCLSCNRSGIGVDEELSPHFWLSDFTRSGKALARLIPNNPTPRQVQNMRRLCVDLLEPLIVLVGAVPAVTSGFRSAALNPLIGGAATSSHLYVGEGDAVDTAWSISRAKVMSAIAESSLRFDQAIYEERPKKLPDGSVDIERWIHLSSRRHDGQQRRRILMSFDGKSYAPFNTRDPRVTT